MVTAAAPEISAEDIAYVVSVHGMLVEDTGRAKFQASDLADGGTVGTDLYEIACAWARTQTRADFEWLRKVALAEAKGKPGTCGLTDKTAAGVLNCLMAQQRRAAARPAGERRVQCSNCGGDGWVYEEESGDRVRCTWCEDGVRVYPGEQPAPAAPQPVQDPELAAHEAYEAWLLQQERAAAEAYEQYRAGQVQQGFYTVVNGGEHRTFKIGPWREDALRPGGRIRWIGLLVGQDNTSDYETCARQISDGTVTMHGRFRQSAQVAEWLAGLMGESVEGHAAARLAYAVESGRCARCGRTLSVPSSLYSGLGPECAKRMEE